MLTLGNILTALLGHVIQNDTPISGAVIDSRLATPGCLFVAIPGENTDGHRYLAQAFAGGAVVALVEKPVSGDWQVLDVRQALATLPELRFPLCLLTHNSVKALQDIAAYYRTCFPGLSVVGITGSVGKTTTKEVLAAMLASLAPTHYNPGNFNNEIGLPLTLLQLQTEHQFAVLEMGFYVPGEIRLLCNIARPQMGIITNIHPVHAERAGSLEAIRRGKAELIEELPAAPQGVAILNCDETLVMSTAPLTKAHVITYGFEVDAEVRASTFDTLGLAGIAFSLSWDKHSLHLQLPWLGRQMVYAAAAATALGWAAGFSPDEIEHGLRHAARHANIRMIQRAGLRNSLILDDTYNASPPSMLAALDTLKHAHPARRWAVLGDMRELGYYEREGHLLVGSVTPGCADYLITVGKPAAQIAEAALANGFAETHVFSFDDYLPALALLQRELAGGDIVLVKGSRAMNLNLLAQALTAQENALS